MVVTPQGFDSALNGSIVSDEIKFSVISSCVVASGTQVGANLLPSYGLKVVDGVTATSFNFSSEFSSLDVYTVPSLESRGLGFVVKYGSWVGFYKACGNIYYYRILYVNRLSVKDMINGQKGMGGIGSQCNSASAHGIYSDFSIYLVKIGNSNQHAALPQNFTVPLIGVSFFDWGSPSTAVGTVVFSVSVTDFSSRVVTRTCTTPTASESIINFGYIGYQVVQDAYLGEPIIHKEFNLTFVCPMGSYNDGRGISFFVEPMYGVFDEFNSGGAVMGRTMKIAQGSGMAQGVGIKLGVKFRYSSSWSDLMFRLEAFSNAGINGKYDVYYFSEYSYSNKNLPTYDVVVPFRASLVRINEPVVSGQIKAVALIHIRYN